MRDKIKETAWEILITHGYQGFRFGDIADRLKITRANIHYQFGTKRKLVDEVLADYIVRTTAEMRSVWCSGLPYEEKVVATMELNRRRYNSFNKRDGTGGAPWS